MVESSRGLTRIGYRLAARIVLQRMCYNGCAIVFSDSMDNIAHM